MWIHKYRHLLQTLLNSISFTSLDTHILFELQKYKQFDFELFSQSFSGNALARLTHLLPGPGRWVRRARVESIKEIVMKSRGSSRQSSLWYAPDKRITLSILTYTHLSGCSPYTYLFFPNSSLNLCSSVIWNLFQTTLKKGAIQTGKSVRRVGLRAQTSHPQIFPLSNKPAVH